MIRALLVASLLGMVGGISLVRRRARERGFEPRVGRLPDDAFPQGERAPLTAFYFTSRLCGACQETPGIVHDAQPDLPIVPLPMHERPDLARAVGVYETPTLLLVDGSGRIRFASVGNPSADELRTHVRKAREPAGVT